MDFATLFQSRRGRVTILLVAIVSAARTVFGIDISDMDAIAIATSIVVWLWGQSADNSKGWAELTSNPKFILLIASVANATIGKWFALPVKPESIQAVLIVVQGLLSSYQIRPHKKE